MTVDIKKMREAALKLNLMATEVEVDTSITHLRADMWDIAAEICERLERLDKSGSGKKAGGPSIYDTSRIPGRK